MGLESVTYISDLVATNPVGATDKKGQGDDHIRNIKTGLLNTFSAFVGAAVTLTEAQINDAILASVDSTVAGRKTFTNAPLSSVDPQILLSASVPMIAWQETGAGADEKVWDITAFGDALLVRTATDAGTATATAISIQRTGTAVNEIELNATLIDINGAVDISGALQVNSTLTVENGDLSRGATAGADIGATAAPWRTVYAQALRRDDGQLTLTSSTEIELNATTFDLNGNLDLSGTAAFNGANISLYAGCDLYIRDAGFLRIQDSGDTDYVTFSHDGTDFSIVGTNTTNLNFSGFGLDFGTCAVTVGGASASEVGFSGAPSVDIGATDNTGPNYSGKTCRFTASGFTFTLDSDPPEDAVVLLDNASGGTVTIAASGTLIWAQTGGTGNRTLADDGLAVALHRGSGVWIINGGGLS